MASIPSNNPKDARDIPQSQETISSLEKDLPSFDKWKYGIEISKASSDDLTSCVEYRTQAYKLKGWTWLSSSSIYAEDFEGFKRKEFDLCTSDVIAEFREKLRKQGVYVSIGRGYPVYKELADLAQVEKPWPENDPLRPICTKSKLQQEHKQGTKAEESTQKSSANKDEYEQYRKLAESTIEKGNDSHHQVCDELSNNHSEHNTYHAPNPNMTPQYVDAQLQSALNQLELEYNHGFSRELWNLQKCYWLDSQKYSGTMEKSFNYKFLIFINNCKRSGIPANVYPQTFPIMLHGSALDYIYHNCDGQNMSIYDLIKHFIRRYENEEHRRNMERKWNGISLRQMVKDNPDKPMEENFWRLIVGIIAGVNVRCVTT
ncbi:putative glycosyl transferase [Golovinomyces cichoracearum]|uniref:Putative glycosyl transferase n=1 Tax=Golovinomyces cichoracearum TaxID=62708 RepID=A0A420IT43_9PEZI|nr:putative glycosyl transferase [Golovinomyces cichoracearum]